MASDSSSGGSQTTEADELTMAHELDIIELVAVTSGTPITKGTVVSDALLTAAGYLGSVDTGATDAVFAATKYGRYKSELLDDFNRSDSATVGNDWAEVGGIIEILSNHLHIDRNGGGTTTCIHSLPSVSPTYFKYQISNPVVTESIGFFLRNSTTAIIYINVGTTSKIEWQGGNMAITNGTEYKIEGKNINWTAHTYDIWINDVEKDTAVPFTNNDSDVDSVEFSCNAVNSEAQIDEVQIGFGSVADGTMVIVCDLPAISGEVTATELVVNDPDRETGDSITYELEDTDTTTQTDLAIETDNTIASIDGTKLGGGKITINLIPKGTAPTTGTPSVRSYALKLTKA